MTSITVYDGSNTIGGSKIYVEDKGKGVFLDFGKNFSKYKQYYQEFLKDRSIRGVHDLIQLDLIPKLNIYRTDLIPSDVDLSKYPSLNIEAILLTHSHQDHYGNIGLLKENYPVIASAVTLGLLKGMLDTSIMNIGIDLVYFSKKVPSNDDERILKASSEDYFARDLICTEDYQSSLEEFLNQKAKSRKTIEGGSLSKIDSISLSFEIESYGVDHSIYGSTAFILNSDVSIAYTGDFRLHGKNSKNSEEFIKKAKKSRVLIIEGTRVGKEDIFFDSETIVKENCVKAVKFSNEKLVIADFTSRNIERMELFAEIALATDRTLVITAKDAYLLYALKQVDGNDRIKNFSIYDELKGTKSYWESNVLRTDGTLKFVDPLDIRKDPHMYIMCFSFFDLKHLLDIRPEGGSYIYSSFGAFEEEQEFDFVRLNNWLTRFSIKPYGFRIDSSSGRPRPVFTRGFHASGHASKEEILWAVEQIDPDTIIPIHTENPQWFIDNFDKKNVALLKEGEVFDI